MRRSWMGLVLLVVLLLSGLGLSSAMVGKCREDSEMLTMAAEKALEENWHQAAILTARARQSWSSWEFFRCAMADHKASEEIDVMFTVLEVHGATRNRQWFAATCQEAARKLEALGDAHRLNLHNLL